MGRAPCCDKANVKKGPWSPEEDAKLKEYIEKHGTGGNWIALPQKVGLRRCGKSCRLRWLNYLRPNIKHGEFSEAEDRFICTLFATIGSRWSIIASQMAGRTDNDIKNYWNTKLKKKMMMAAMNHHPSPSLPQRKQPQQQITLLSSSSQSSSSPLSFSNNNSTYYHPHSYSSSILSGNSNSNSNFQGGFMNSNNNSIFMFGGEAAATTTTTTSCSSSGSHHVIKPELIGDHGAAYNVNYNYNDGSVVGGLWAENPLDYGIQEIKELIGTANCNNSSFLFDDMMIMKTEERIMY